MKTFIFIFDSLISNNKENKKNSLSGATALKMNCLLWSVLFPNIVKYLCANAPTVECKSAMNDAEQGGGGGEGGEGDHELVHRSRQEEGGKHQQGIVTFSFRFFLFEVHIS